MRNPTEFVSADIAPPATPHPFVVIKTDMTKAVAIYVPNFGGWYQQGVGKVEILYWSDCIPKLPKSVLQKSDNPILDIC